MLVESTEGRRAVEVEIIGETREWWEGTGRIFGCLISLNFTFVEGKSIVGFISMALIMNR